MIDVEQFKERPILFSTEMVKAILAGTKTQTRRIVPNIHKLSDGTWYDRSANDLYYLNDEHFKKGFPVDRKCPFGKVGDRLWVRETFSLNHSGHKSHATSDGTVGILYRASWIGELDYYDRPFKEDRRWRPSIHMPRWASRINLEITNIRVERLRDISEDDAKEEGAKPYDQTAYFTRNQIDNSSDESFEYRAGFFDLWINVYGSQSLYENPWVWVIEFKKLGL